MLLGHLVEADPRERLMLQHSAILRIKYVQFLFVRLFWVARAVQALLEVALRLFLLVGWDLGDQS